MTIDWPCVFCFLAGFGWGTVATLIVVGLT